MKGAMKFASFVAEDPQRDGFASVIPEQMFDAETPPFVDLCILR
jgi:hypothetical protein